MSVYTRVSKTQLQLFLNRYELGKLIYFQGIENGIENTNYQVKTTHGDFILTIFEERKKAHLRDIFVLLDHLQQSNLPIPQAQNDRQSHQLNCLNNKPAAFFNRLHGVSVETPTPTQCREIGQQLASLHIYSQQLSYQHDNPKDLNGCQTLFKKLTPYLNQQDIKQINAELAFQKQYTRVNLPKGIIHADLFRDNVLFNNGKMSGMLDFYNSCYDYLLQDVAITINDWCKEDTFINQINTANLLVGYQSIRPLVSLEKQLLPAFLRRTSLFFWLSHLNHQIFPKAGDITQQKDPTEFRGIFKQHCLKQKILGLVTAKNNYIVW